MLEITEWGAISWRRHDRPPLKVTKRVVVDHFEPVLANSSA
jgi:hypothetical protein